MTDPQTSVTVEPDAVEGVGAAPTATARKGDWVRVFGQVINDNPHPDEMLVEFFSHNTQYQVLVERKRIERCAPPEGISYRCTAMIYDGWTGRYARCEHHDGHGGTHNNGRGAAEIAWPDSATVGHFEGRS